VLAAQAARAFVYGLGSVVIGVSLERAGRSATQAGVILACLLAGAALVSVLLARYGDRAGRRRSYCLLLVVMGGAGAVFSLTTWTPALALAARLYNTVATLAGSLGALSAVVAGSQRWLLAYPAAAALGLLATVRLSPRVEVGSELEPRPRSPLHRSRGTVLRLSSLFALDSFGRSLGVPVIAGALKSLYDLGLWAIFRQVDPKTESATAA